MTIYRGPGGGGNADSDAEINALTALTNQSLAYSEAAALEADAAAASAAAASTSAASAATSASGAATSATNAASSASSASTSASSASTSATNAASSASAASTSATNAASSASAASTSATNAAASETNAATSAASALTYSTASAASAVTASTQAGNAATSASAAAGSATTASTQASNAATSASSASTSATNAASSASAASASAAAALASETAAAASVASIDLPTIVRTTGDQTIGGIKTFSSTIVGSVNGNAATATNVAYSGLTGTVPTWNQNTTGSAATVTTTIASGAVATTQTAGDNSTKVATTAYVNSITGTNGIIGFKNRIINGAMVIDQRNAGASVSGTTGVYTLDRWKVQNNSGAARFNVQQNAGSVTPPAGFKNYLGITSTSAYSVAASDIIAIQQFIEGYNIADLAWGTASAATITFSFWVRSSLTGTFGGSLVEGAAGGALYPFTYTISAANTWEQKTVTVVGPTIGTWNSTNGAGIQLLFSMGTGSTFTGAAGSWTTSSFYAPTGATSVVGTSGATFYITGVQLEKGSTATSFDYRPYGTELALCQRYLPAFRYNSVGTILPALTQFNSSSTSRGFITFPVPTRATVTGMTISSPSHFVLQSYAGGSSTPNSFTQHVGGTNGAGIDVNFASAVSADKNTGVLQIDNSAGYVYFTGAEL